MNPAAETPVSYFILLYGRQKESYNFTYYSTTPKTLDEFTADFEMAAKKVFEEVVELGLHLSNDFSITDLCGKMLYRLGYREVTIYGNSLGWAYESDDNFKTSLITYHIAAKDSSQLNACIYEIYLYNEMYLDTPDMHIFQNSKNPEEFNRLCSAFQQNHQSITDPGKMSDSFLQLLSQNGFEELNMHSLFIGCSTSQISEHWIEIVGQSLFDKTNGIKAHTSPTIKPAGEKKNNEEEDLPF